MISTCIHVVAAAAVAAAAVAAVVILNDYAGKNNKNKNFLRK